MKKVFIVVAMILLKSIAFAQAADLLTCSTGGFFYNNLTVVDDGLMLHFTSDGNGLTIKSDKLDNLEPRDSIQDVRFSFSKSDCDLTQIKDSSFVCTTKSLSVTTRVYNSNTQSEKFIVDEQGYVSLLMRQTLGDFNNIKLLLISSTNKERLVTMDLRVV